MPAVAIATEELTGVQRAAILVMYLDQEVARTLLRRLDSRELQQVGLAMASIEHVGPEVIDHVVSEFLQNLHAVSLMPKSGTDYVHDVLPGIIDPEREEVLRTLRRRVDREFEAFVASQPPRNVAIALREEHPQSQAVALCLMGPVNAARVLRHLDEQVQAEITRRMARLQTIPGELADDVRESLKSTLGASLDHLPVGGVERTARILGRLRRDVNERVLSQISEDDEELASTLRRGMVTFEDLGSLDDRSIQRLLKNVDREELVRALKGASHKTRERFLRNLSTRAAEDIRESLEIMGPMRRQVLEEAQGRIALLAMELADKGEIFLVLGEEDAES